MKDLFSRRKALATGIATVAGTIVPCAAVAADTGPSGGTSPDACVLLAEAAITWRDAMIEWKECGDDWNRIVPVSFARYMQLVLHDRLHEIEFTPRQEAAIRRYWATSFAAGEARSRFDEILIEVTGKGLVGV